jgi:ribonucleoside-diphosphate reductase alpha chain
MEDQICQTATEAKTFTYQEVYASCMTYFNGDELAATTWMNKYCLKNVAGEFVEQSPDEMHRRMAKAFFDVESAYSNLFQVNAEQRSSYGQSRNPLTEQTIYQLFKGFGYLIPQGSVMSVLGNPYVTASLSNCVVIKAPVDSYGGIMYTDQQLAQLCKRRCGVGFDISSIRPSGLPVSNAAGTSSGVVSFMERFSNTTREVSQNGRRGALMLTMDVAHPDILQFIEAKQDLTKVTGANISVRVSDAFMRAVENDGSFDLHWPIDDETPTVTQTIVARDLWNRIISCAHKTAEPGIIYWDRQHHYSTSSVYPAFKNDSTNPCAEIAMQGGDSCRLMAMNMYKFVNGAFTSEATFDFKKFYEVTYESQRLMDDLVDLEVAAVDRIIEKIGNDPESDSIKQVELDTWKLLRDNGRKGRRTGLGFTALADALAALGLRFDSEESIALIDEIMCKKCEAEFDSSIDMALERGAFEAFDTKVEETSEFVHFLKERLPQVHDRMMKFGRRNISISTVAPTGTVSLLAQTSSGIEPVYMLSYKRRRKLANHEEDSKKYFKDELGDVWEEFDVYHHKLKIWMEHYPDKPIALNPYRKSTAAEIDWKKRIKIQSVIQKYVTHSISSTINLPNDTSESVISDIYLQAWKAGLKGITVYRDGSRTGVLVSNDVKEENNFKETKAPIRPKQLVAKVIRFQNFHEHWLAFVGVMDGKPYEVFTGRAEDSFALPNWVTEGWILKSKEENKESRYDFRYVDRQGYHVTIEGLSRSFDKEYWNYAKLISGVLRHGMPIENVVHLIDNMNLEDHINTWKNGVSRALRHFIQNGTVSKDHLCTACGDEEGLIFEEGCLKCKSCGHTKCG